MEEDTFNWGGLPLQIRIDVASFLNPQERFPLQICSTSDFDVVSHCPVRLQELAIKLIQTDPAPSTFNFQASIKPFERTRSIVQKRNLSLDNAILEFIQLFKNRNSQIDKLIFHNRFGPNMLLRGLVEKMKQEQSKIEFRVEEIEWKGCAHSDFVIFTELLRYFDESVLETFRIEGQEISREAASKLTSMEQFKRIKNVFITPVINIGIGSFTHLQTVELLFETFSEEDALEMFQSFQTSCLPESSYFTLKSLHSFKNGFKDRLLDLLGLENNEEARSSLSRNVFNHVQSFECSSPECNLLLKIDDYSVFGVISTKEFIRNRTQDISVFMDLMEYGFEWKTNY